MATSNNTTNKLWSQNTRMSCCVKRILTKLLKCQEILVKKKKYIYINFHADRSGRRGVVP